MCHLTIIHQITSESHESAAVFFYACTYLVSKLTADEQTITINNIGFGDPQMCTGSMSVVFWFGSI